MTPRAIGTIVRTVVPAFAVTVFATLAFAPAASAAPPKPSPKPTKAPVLSITITGPGVGSPIVIQSNREPALYDEIDAQVEWMKGAPGNVMPSTPTQLGPDYTVTLRSGGTKTAVYDLYPLVSGGPRAHRSAIGSQKGAWFFAPVSMASGLQAAGVELPTTPASGAVAPPTVATSAPSTSLTRIMAESKLALGLAAGAAAAVLMVLALAARRSRRLDRRRAVPAAIARLESVAGRARGGAGPGSPAFAAGGPAIRGSVPAARGGAGYSRATGTARVQPPGPPTSSPPKSGPARSAATSGSERPASASGSERPAATSGARPASNGPATAQRTGPSPAGLQPLGAPSYGSRADQVRDGSTGPGQARTDARLPGPRAAADESVTVPAEVAVGTAHVVAAASSTSSAIGDARVTGADESVVAVAPAPRTPADESTAPETASTPPTGAPETTTAETASDPPEEPETGWFSPAAIGGSGPDSSVAALVEPSLTAATNGSVPAQDTASAVEAVPVDVGPDHHAGEPVGRRDERTG